MRLATPSQVARVITADTSDGRSYVGRVTTRTWDRLAPQVDAVPKSSTHPGRVHVVQGFTAHSTQVLLMTEAEAAGWVAITAADES